MTEGRIPEVAIIIPAYNEAGRIGNVLRAVVGSKLANEILVVCDGCTDDTAQVARRFDGVRVVELRVNRGKGGAMAAGVSSTKATVLAFVDADLQGLRPEHVDGIIRPILERRCDMCVGVFRGGKYWSDTAQKISPYLSGQRAIRRELFEAVPYASELRLGIEVAINQAARRKRARIIRVVLRGVSNCHKEQKMGIVKGTAARAKMYVEIGQAMVKTHRTQRVRKPKWR
jgi:glycosyltransferase involved in cell wall biosynthesis